MATGHPVHWSCQRCRDLIFPPSWSRDGAQLLRAPTTIVLTFAVLSDQFLGLHLCLTQEESIAAIRIHWKDGKLINGPNHQTNINKPTWLSPREASFVDSSPSKKNELWGSQHISQLRSYSYLCETSSTNIEGDRYLAIPGRFSWLSSSYNVSGLRTASNTTLSKPSITNISSLKNTPMSCQWSSKVTWHRQS